MAELSAIRGGIAQRLLTISGLRALDYVRGSIAPPIGVVGWPEIEYDRTMTGGVHEYNFPVRVYVASSDNRAANDALELFLAPSGSRSVKAAIEGDRTLAGVVKDLHVQRVAAAGWVEHGANSYLAADWDVLVLA